MNAPAVHRTVSADGTEIAYFTSGAGPPLVLVPGGATDHRHWDRLRPHLEPQVTVHAMDPRGRGASGDGPEYDIEREYEDVAAVIDAVAEASGSRVAVYGHSGGGACAYGAARLTSNLDALVLYEGWPPPNPEYFDWSPELLERMDQAVAAGQREAFADEFIAGMADHVASLGASQQQSDEIRAWYEELKPALLDSIDTVPRTLRVWSSADSDPLAFDPEHAAEIGVPTLLQVDPAVPYWSSNVDPVVEALPDARLSWFDRQYHHAVGLSPQTVADDLLAFLGEQR